MKQSDLTRVYSDIPQGFHDALFAAAHGVKEEETVMKRKAWILAMALIAILIAGTALALVNHYSVRQFEAGGSPSAAFEAHVVSLDQTYENDYITFTLTDAIFDGEVVAIAMHLDSKNPDKPVYLRPKLTGMCGDRVLDLDIQGMRGDFMSGFIFPSLEEDWLEGNYGVDAALYEDEADGDVIWTLRVGVFEPNWPIKNAEYPMDSDGNYAQSDSPERQAYDQGFREAYERQEILATWGDSLVEYAWLGLPMPEGMTEEAYVMLPLEEMLVLSGAFTQVDTLEYSFTTKLPEDYKTGIGKGLTFPMDSHTVEIEALDISFMRVSYAFSLVFPAGTSQEEAKALLPRRYILLDQDGNELMPAGEGRHVEAGPDGTWIARVDGVASFHIDAPSEICFVPYTYDESGIEEPDEAHAFTVQVTTDGM